MIPGIAEQIILGETNPVRFEKFCTELLSSSEGITLVPTSTTYDRGRDARSLSASRGSHAAIVCVSLNQEVDEKTEADLERVVSTSSPDRLIYCSSQKLTEHKIDQLTASVRSHLPATCSVLVVGSIQLAHLAEKFDTIFGKFYPGEIKTIEDAFLSTDAREDTASTRGLRLALIAFGTEDARALRTNVSRRAVSDALKSLKTAAAPAIAVKLSADLRLPRTINSQFLQTVLDGLQRDGFVSEELGKWSLTEKGKSEATSIPPEAVRQLLAGRTIIRQSLEGLTGIKLPDKQFESLWSTLLDFLSEGFYSNGFAIIEAVNELLSSRESDVGSTPNLDALLHEAAKRIGALFSGPELGEEHEQAVLDMFTERSGPAFEWLSNVCERYVALCALGLEASSTEEVKAVLRRHRLVLDSDIILKFLCEAEPEHTVVRDLIARWRRLGGKLLLSTPILEEVAHHAWISEAGYRDNKYLLGKLEPNELRRYAENAFVRAFLFLERNLKDADKKWRIYIGQFRGTRSFDYSNVLGVLQDELGAEVMPCSYDDSLKTKISNDLCQMLAELKGIGVEQLSKQDVGKAERDGQVLACLAEARETQRRLGFDLTVSLLSSSTRLRKEEHRFRQYFGSPNAVISLGVLTYLISLLPDVSLGAGSLRRALFEFGESAHLPDPQRLALRMIKATGEFSIPWARRRTLSRHLEKTLHIEARKRSQDIGKLKREFVEAKETANPAEIVVQTLRTMAVNDAKTEALNQATRSIRVLETKVSELQRELIRKRRPRPKSTKHNRKK
jgi:hypothetical protein